MDLFTLGEVEKGQSTETAAIFSGTGANVRIHRPRHASSTVLPQRSQTAPLNQPKGDSRIRKCSNGPSTTSEELPTPPKRSKTVSVREVDSATANDSTSSVPDNEMNDDPERSSSSSTSLKNGRSIGPQTSTNEKSLDDIRKMWKLLASGKYNSTVDSSKTTKRAKGKGKKVKKYAGKDRISPRNIPLTVPVLYVCRGGW